MANESNAVIGGVVVGLVFIGIALLIGEQFYEQCVDDWLDDRNCLGDDWYYKEGECCTTRYSWQAWCCGLPFALIGIGIIGASLSPKVDEIPKGKKTKANPTKTKNIKKQPSCDFCGKKFRSRNKLFDHLKEFPDHGETDKKARSSKKEGNDVESTREKYNLEEEYSDEDIAFVNQWKNELMEKEKKSEDENPSGGSENSLADELKKLSDLKEQGILDDDEFKSAKKKLIEKQ